MLNISILDVALGLAFSFMAVSLVASALVEAVSSILNLRAKGLVTGIGRLLNDPDIRELALRLYQHTAVNPAGVLTAAVLQGDPDAVDLRHPPAYIGPRQFASAIMDVTGLSAAAARDYGSAGEAITAMAPAFDALRAENPQLADLIGGIALRARGKSELIETGIARCSMRPWIAWAVPTSGERRWGASYWPWRSPPSSTWTRSASASCCGNSHPSRTA